MLHPRPMCNCGYCTEALAAAGVVDCSLSSVTARALLCAQTRELSPDRVTREACSLLSWDGDIQQFEMIASCADLAEK
eukprot:2827026-Amphidinium_carterae.1